VIERLLALARGLDEDRQLAADLLLPTYSSSSRGRSARSTTSSWTPATFALTSRLSSSFSMAIDRAPTPSPAL
jgi:hypothetical protein